MTVSGCSTGTDPKLRSIQPDFQSRRSPYVYWRFALFEESGEIIGRCIRASILEEIKPRDVCVW